MPYADGTSVSPEKSQMEIAALIRKYGASSFITGFDQGSALVEFIAHERRVRFLLDLPADPAAFTKTAAGRTRPPADRKGAMDAEIRRRWRALALAIKAKLEVVETGIGTFESEFLSHIVLPDGKTVAEHVMPRMHAAFASNAMPTSLLAIEGEA